MQETEFYRKLLGLEKPWRVGRVEVKLAELQVHVWVEHGTTDWLCPECARTCPLYDHQEERVWRHLDTMQYTTLLHARPPRIECEEHGVKNVRLPWADRRSRFTLMFERFAIDVLRMTSVGGACSILRVSWDEAWKIKERAVERGLARKERVPPRYVGIDEKAFRPGVGSYVTVVSDLLRGSVEWVASDRTARSVNEYFDQFTDAQLSTIDGFAMDMWRAYTKAVSERIPDADSKIIYDRFHVMKEVNEALDQIRKAEHREQLQQGQSILTGTKYLWLAGHENVSPRRRAEFAWLRKRKLKTGRAWAIKEMLRELWAYKTPSRAAGFWKRWFYWASHSKLDPILKAARKLKKHEQRILNYFQHRITNSVAEAINGRIERLNRIANGFRNPQNFRTAILFHHGGLNLYPVTH